MPNESSPPPISRILLVEDSEDDAALLRADLGRLDRHVELRRVEDAPQMAAALADGEWDLVIADHRLPRFDAIRAFELLRAAGAEVPFIIMSGTMPEEAAATVMSLGASDFIDKSKRARLIPVIERELRQSRVSRAKRDAEDSVRRLTYRDTLTNLPNGRMLAEAMEAAFGAGGTRESLLVVLNLDRFRRINESYGHDAGDRLLKQAARRFARSVPGAAAARLAQDRFAVFVPGVSADAAESAARTVAASLKAPFDLAGQPIFLSCTAGYVVHPEDGHEAGLLLQRAESAMFDAKRDGPGGLARYDLDPARRHAPLLRLEQSLRLALPRNEMFLLYQPLVDLATGSLAGVEALLRWRHPDLGTLGPGRFVPLADETGLVQDLGAWVLDEALRQARAWRECKVAVPVSVNVSAVQFHRAAIADDLARALEAAGLAAEAIEVEITETVLMNDAESTIRTLRRLKDMGVRIAVDDFGTGYSSLAYLKRFPIDVLKIDRGFVQGVHDDQDSLAIVRTIVALAKALKLRLVAEGVETPAQAVLLRSLGCERAQGYLFARPMPGNLIATWAPARVDDGDARPA